MKKSLILVFLCVTVIFLASGCGKKGLETYYVEGKVTVDGQPAKGVLLRFVPKDPGNLEEASGTTDENGMYKLTATSGLPEAGAVAGEYAVMASMLDMTPVNDASKSKEGVETLSYKELLPKIYLGKDSTPLKASIGKTKNLGVDFVIETKR